MPKSTKSILDIKCRTIAISVLAALVVSSCGSGNQSLSDSVNSAGGSQGDNSLTAGLVTVDLDAQDVGFVNQGSGGGIPSTTDVSEVVPGDSGLGEEVIPVAAAALPGEVDVVEPAPTLVVLPNEVDVDEPAPTLVVFPNEVDVDEPAPTLAALPNEVDVDEPAPTLEALPNEVDVAEITPAPEASLSEVDAVDPTPTSAPLPSEVDVVELMPTSEALTSEVESVENAASALIPVFEPDNVIGSQVGDVRKILSNVEVSTAQLNVQTTPIAASGGYVYTANIEHGPDGDAFGINLRTVIRQGRQAENGEWEWTSFLLEDRTVHDAWHTSPSIAVDTDGYIHVVYNMHNFPWQYKRSVNPHDITSWDFLGDEISTSQLEAFRFENKVSYPTHGSSDIPGNQITYPAFFYNRENEIYLSYRFAARPARAFEQRTFSGGLAKYNVVDRTWTSIGAEVDNEESDFQYDENSRNNAISLAGEMGWTVYHPRIVFDASNNIGVFHYWRSGIAGEKLGRPCFFRQNANGSYETASGESVTLPLTNDNCGNLGVSDSQAFYSVGNATAGPTGIPSIVLSPDGGDVRFILTYSDETGQWEREDSPGNALEIFYDKEGNLWAATHRLKLYRRLANETTWQKVFEDDSGNECYPKVRMNATGTVAYIHTQACDSKSISVYGVQLTSPN